MTGRHDGHDHAHGHAADQGLSGVLRYLRWAPQMWRSEITASVIGLADLQAGETIVDVGAGMGAGTITAARTGASVIAVEPTPFLRRILAVRRLGQRARSRVTVVDGAAEALPVPDSTVDVVVAVNTMHHWVDLDRGLAELGRVLRPGGRIVLVDEDFDDPAHPDHDRFGSDHDLEAHGFKMVDADDLGERAQRAGLVEIEASRRLLGDRPVVAVTAQAPG